MKREYQNRSRFVHRLRFSSLFCWLLLCVVSGCQCGAPAQTCQSDTDCAGDEVCNDNKICRNACKQQGECGANLNCIGSVCQSFCRSYFGTGNISFKQIRSGHKGQLYIAGDFDQTLRVRPHSLTGKTPGKNDVATVSFSSQGVVRWAHSFGANEFNPSIDMVVDLEGNMYVLTYAYQGDMGISTVIPKVSKSDYLVKINPEGKILWALSGFHGAQQLAVSPKGDVYMAGLAKVWDDEMVFVSHSIKKRPELGVSTSYIAKINPQGSFDWVTPVAYSGEYKTMGCPFVHLAVHSKIFLTHCYENKLHIQGKTYQANGVSDTAVIQLDQNGSIQWHKRIQSERYVKVEDIAATSSGEVVLVGGFQDSLSIGSMVLSREDVRNYNDMAFVIRLHSSGQPTFLRTLEGIAQDEHLWGVRVLVDKNEDIFMLSVSKTIAETPFGVSVHFELSYYVTKWSKDRKLLWMTKKLEKMFINGMTLRSDKALVLMGHSRETVQLGNFALSSNATKDMFVYLALMDSETGQWTCGP